MWYGKDEINRNGIFKLKADNSAAAEKRFGEGNRLMAEGRWHEAAQCYRQVVGFDPDCAEAYANLGIVHENLHEFGPAEQCYRRSILLNPGHAQVHSNLGILLARQSRFIEAETAYRHALLVDPASPAAWSNLGVLLASLKREDEAERCYRAALRRNPDYWRASFNLSYLLLRQGHFEEGWTCLEKRVYDGLPDFHFPRWQGEPLDGKALLIHHELGHGDAIQFCRYVPLLKTRWAVHITLTCPPALKTLFATLAGADLVLSTRDALPERHYDYWTLPLSLPFQLGTRLDSIPQKIPYLRAPQERIEKWAKKIPRSGFRVGLVWKGNPLHENDNERSLPSLETLAPLAQIPGVRFVSLQKGAGEEEAKHPPDGFPLLDLGPDIEDFADTAAIATQLDLIISIDTATAHLAGALALPCWVLIPDFIPDWRWLDRCTDSPWYPQVVRLFRQPPEGGWTAVVKELAAELCKR